MLYKLIQPITKNAFKIPKAYFKEQGMQIRAFILAILFAVSFAKADDIKHPSMPWQLEPILWKIQDKKVVRKALHEPMIRGATTFNGKSFYFFTIEDNATLKKEYEEHLSKERDFCNDFYDDLFEWKNISVIKPLVFDTTDYNNPVLKKNMGDCWYMDMNKTIKDGFSGRGFTLYKFDNKLLYIMIYKTTPYIYQTDDFANLAYILDPKECSKITKDSRSRVNLEIPGNIIYKRRLFYAEPIRYKDIDYLLFIDFDNTDSGQLFNVTIRKFKDGILQMPVCSNSYVNTKLYR